MDRFFILFIDDQIQLIQIEHGKAIVHGQPRGACGEAFSLEFGRDDDLELGPAVHMVDLNQLDQSGFIAVAFDDKAALTLIVNMFVVEIGKFNEGLIRLFKPIAHYAGVVIELVDKAQIFALKGAESDV